MFSISFNRLSTAVADHCLMTLYQIVLPYLFCCFETLNIQRTPNLSLQVPQYPQNSSWGATAFEPFCESTVYKRSASSFVSGFRQIVTLFPSISLCPRLSRTSVAIISVPPRIGNATCITFFLSSSEKAGMPGADGISPMCIRGAENSVLKIVL